MTFKLLLATISHQCCPLAMATQEKQCHISQVFIIHLLGWRDKVKSSGAKNASGCTNRYALLLTHIWLVSIHTICIHLCNNILHVHLTRLLQFQSWHPPRKVNKKETPLSLRLSYIHCQTIKDAFLHLWLHLF